jgi:uncharacterized protein YegL
MENKKTKSLITIILDESGSMSGMKEDVITNFNNFIENQKKNINDEARLTLLTFNSKVNLVYNFVPLEKVKPLNSRNYIPGGQTALYDAINAGNYTTYCKKLEDEKVIFVIMTDGQENCSIHTDKEKVKKIIKRIEFNDEWNLLYIGADPEAWVREIGGSKDNSIDFDVCDSQKNFEAMERSVSGFRDSKSKNYLYCNKNCI